MHQKVIPYLSFNINGLQIENVYNFNFYRVVCNPANCYICENSN